LWHIDGRKPAGIAKPVFEKALGYDKIPPGFSQAKRGIKWSNIEN
jgi:hypothetical protein